MLFCTGIQRGGVTKKGSWGGVCGVEIVHIVSFFLPTNTHINTYGNKNNVYNPWPCKVGFGVRFNCFCGGVDLILNTNSL